MTSALAAPIVARVLIALYSTPPKGPPAYAFENGCKLSRDGKTLLEYIGDGGELTIPEGVEVVGSLEFCRCSSLSTIVLPDSVKEIAPSAFYRCYALDLFVVPSGVQEIRERTFDHCDALKTPIVPSSVKRIGNLAFGSFDGISIIAPKGSFAEEFAKEYKIPYTPF